jgi:hypothetical protein
MQSSLSLVSSGAKVILNTSSSCLYLLSVVITGTVLEVKPRASSTRGKHTPIFRKPFILILGYSRKITGLMP